MVKKTNRKLTIISIMIFLIAALSGCISEEQKIDSITIQSSVIKNIPPIPVISSPKSAFFGETIEFDASQSYDKDGTIKSYTWYFGDETSKKGQKINQVFEMPNDFDYKKSPYIYYVQLNIVDNNGSCIICQNPVILYLKQYTMFLDSGHLLIDKPLKNSDKIKLSDESSYDLTDEISLQKCTYKAEIYLEKPLLTFVKGATLTLYGENGEEISKTDENIGLISFWKEKKIGFSGEITGPVKFKSIKLVIHGFPLRNKINIMFGGEQPSQIIFDFTN
ncbi:MAG: hypothetical protein DRN27_10395 [Thermoplasmata archaeon]|nr:MAG: hypothetical protein DRN27_10395 [Thermoplasmata archaeon]